MIRIVLSVPLMLTLAGCNGTYGGDIGGVPVTPFAFGAAQAEPSTTGSFAGIAAADTTVAQDAAGNGYAFAYSIVNAADYGAGTGQARLAVAGVLPQTDLGTAPVFGTAIMAGSYQAVRVTGANTAQDPATWTVTRPTGALSANIDFATGILTATSTDGALLLSADADAGFASGFAGTATFDGTAGTFDGVIGPNDAVAAMSGRDDSSAFAGGFVIGR